MEHNPVRGFDIGTVPTEERSQGPVVGEWRGKDKLYFDDVSLIDSESFQVSCRFPDLIRPTTQPCLSQGQIQDFGKCVCVWGGGGGGGSRYLLSTKMRRFEEKGTT